MNELDHPDDEGLFAFVEGALEPADRDALAAHLDGCPACCRQVAAHVAGRPRFPALELPAAFWDHYDATFAARLAAGAARHRTPWQRLVDLWRRPVVVPAPLAAGAALALVLLTGALVGSSPIDGSVEATPADTVLMTDVDAASLPSSDYL